MTELQSISEFRWDTGSREIRFEVTSGQKRIKCRVSPDYLEGQSGPLHNVDDFFSGAESWRGEILLAVKKLVDARRFEANGSLLLGTFDQLPVA